MANALLILISQDFLCGAARNVGAIGVGRCAERLFSILGAGQLLGAVSDHQTALPEGTHEAVAALVAAFHSVRRRWRSSRDIRSPQIEPAQYAEPPVLPSGSPVSPPTTSGDGSGDGSAPGRPPGRTTSAARPPPPPPPPPPPDATDAFLADARRRLAAVQRLHAAGDAAGLRAEARALASAAAAAGARGVARAAAALCDRRSEHSSDGAGPDEPGAGSGPAVAGGAVRRGAVDGLEVQVDRGAVDGLEVQVDAIEAIWRSCRLLI
jgi:hypothetical protein